MGKASRLLFTIFALISMAMAAGIAAAGEDGSRIIQFSGALAEGQRPDVTVKDIEQAGLQEFTVFNPYEQREERYTGVFIKDLVEKFGSDSVDMITLTAIDHYSVDFNKDEWDNFRILLSTRVNGDYFGFDRKGPMRIVFPDYDASKLDYQELLPKWMWMIIRIEFKE